MSSSAGIGVIGQRGAWRENCGLLADLGDPEKDGESLPLRKLIFVGDTRQTTQDSGNNFVDVKIQCRAFISGRWAWKCCALVTAMTRSAASECRQRSGC